jgi:hypothetical protein
MLSLPAEILAADKQTIQTKLKACNLLIALSAAAAAATYINSDR